MRALATLAVALMLTVLAGACGGSTEVPLAEPENQQAAQEHLQRIRQMEQNTVQQGGGAVPGGDLSASQQ